MSGGTTSGSECNIKGEWLSCPANSKFTFNGQEKLLDAFLECPLDSVDQSQFVEASQQGKCQCDSALRNEGETPDQASDIDCECFACPVGSRFGFAYQCDRPILFNCKTFNCFGECNGKYNAGLDPVTDAPTAVPVDVLADSSASGMNQMSAAALAVLLVIKMLR